MVYERPPGLVGRVWPVGRMHAELQRTYMHRVTIHDYRTRLHAGLAPRPEDVHKEIEVGHHASWVTYSNRRTGRVNRVFAFRVPDDLKRFKERWIDEQGE